MMIQTVIILFIAGVILLVLSFNLRRRRKNKIKELQEKNLELNERIAQEQEQILQLRRSSQQDKERFERKIAKQDEEKSELQNKYNSLEAKISYYRDKDGNSFVERRGFSRLILAVGIKYSLLGKEAVLGGGNSKNISAGGICITVDEQVEVGDVMSLELNLPGDSRPIQAKGVVKWRNFVGSQDRKSRWDVGIEFMDIGEIDKKKIEKFVFVTLR